MEKFSELIRIRRSMRKFTEEELNQDEVVALLRAALISPFFQRECVLGSSWSWTIRNCCNNWRIARSTEPN